MASEKLTALKVDRARTPGLLNDGKGLYLRIAAGKAGVTKSWVFRFMITGRAREMGLGSLDVVSLGEARERAREWRRLVKEGVDPIEARNARRAAARVETAKALSFAECAQRYIMAHRDSWKNAKHAGQWSATLEAYVFPTIGKLPVASIDTALVTKTLEPIWAAKPHTASRVRGRIEAVLDWATAHKHRLGENPARWKGHLEFLLPRTSKLTRVERHAALPYAEVSAFMAELQQQNNSAAVRALEFTILTATRTGEVLGARWDELDLTEKVWAIPPSRMKAGAAHRVPLCNRTIEILEEMRIIRQGVLVFPGARKERPLSHEAMLRVLRSMKRDNLTVHGFRASFRDWASELTRFPREVCEMALAHAIENKAEASYRRGDLFQKRRQLMTAWARYCSTPAITAGEVVALTVAR
jgi:integrase